MILKKSILAMTLVTSVFAVSGCEAITGKKITESSADNEKVSYSIGYMMAEGNKETITDLDLKTFEVGFKDGYEGTESALTKEQMQEVLTKWEADKQKQMVEELQTMASDNKEAGAKFLAENKSKDGIKTTASGLQYKVVTEGSGGKPSKTDIVKVDYEGKLLDGTVFDSSYKRGKPVEFPLNQVIPGWTEGVQLMTKGSKYEFYIPSDLAYGENGAPGIQPNSTLIFTVELLDFKAQ